MSKPKRKPQTPKPRNEAYMAGMQELRRSNAAGVHRSANDYRRKPKHVKRGWDA